ncbi:MAG TPA: AraC family transcriptional regulator [Puia sp.]
MESSNSHNILFSCQTQKAFSTEQIALEHTLVYIVSGRLELQFSNQKIVSEAEEILIVRRNVLLKALKIPDENRTPFKSVNIQLTEEVLRIYATQNKIIKQEKYTGSLMLNLSRNKFIRAYFDSLMPYFNQPEKLSSKMADLKSQEAIELLLDANHNLEQFLFDLSEPHKIDLEKFMNTNYLFNIPLTEFAWLTGRSLSTFKRDFKTVFNTTPEKWLKDRRLDEAKYLISEKKQKPSEVYYNVGFENFSHFSTAFKQRFGHNASGK